MIRDSNKRRRAASWATFFIVWGAISFGGYQLVAHPDTPLPDHWNPVKPLDASAPLTPLTNWKLRRISGDRAACLAALDTIAGFSHMADKDVSDQCHIRNRVKISLLSDIEIRGTETRCDLALVTAMWLKHGVQPAADFHFGQPVRAVRTQGSYNCRAIAGTSRMSQHATARAIDVAGFTLADGQKIELSQDWEASGAKSQFLRDVRDISCTWFKTTLGPDYNRAHHDHFHFQLNGWGTCR
ncbi:MAG: extensin family protein [Planktomarina sp.]